MAREIGLVSCVKSKRDEPALPADLYTSDYFEKMREYAESHHNEWYILSAKQGLLEPDGDPIAPYDETLRHFSKAEQREWAQRVKEQMDDAGLLNQDVTLVVHAGKDYYEELLPLVEDDIESVEIPTEGLAIGKTKAWYKENI
jgi:hypothetical protein